HVGRRGQGGEGADERGNPHSARLRRGYELVTDFAVGLAGAGTIEHDVADIHEHHEHHEPTGILKWLTSTDHKVIGLSYTITSVVMFVIGGVLAAALRVQLTSPNR